MRIRNVSGEKRTVPELSWRVVDVDEVVEVPDERADAYLCQQSTWAPEDGSLSYVPQEG